VAVIDRSILNLFVDPIRHRLGLSDLEIGLILGPAFGILYAIAVIPFGRLADLGNRRSLVGGAVALWSLCTALSGVAGGFAAMVLARIGVGAGEAALTPTAYSLLADIVGKPKLGRAIGIYSMGGTVGISVALIAGGTMAGALGTKSILLPVIGSLEAWQMVFITMGLLGLILALVFVWSVAEPIRSSAEQVVPFSAVIRYVWKERAYYIPVYAAYCALCAVTQGFFAWEPTYFRRTYGLSVTAVGQVLGVIFLVTIILGSLSLGWLTDRLYAKLGPAASVVVMRIAFALLIPVSMFGFGSSNLLLSLGGTAYTTFFCAGLLALGAVAIQTRAPARMRGQLGSILLLCANLIGLAVGPVAVAILAKGSSAQPSLGPALAILTLVFSSLGLIACIAARPKVGLQNDGAGEAAPLRP
jgi:MFS family permease